MPSPVPCRKLVDSTPDTDQMFINDNETEHHRVQDDDNHGSSLIDTEFSSSQSSQKPIKSQEDNNPYLMHIGESDAMIEGVTNEEYHKDHDDDGYENMAFNAFSVLSDSTTGSGIGSFISNSSTVIL
ncbi:17693_t:CDS:2, partial [Funneliformis caledonium]